MRNNNQIFHFELLNKLKIIKQFSDESISFLEKYLGELVSEENYMRNLKTLPNQLNSFPQQFHPQPSNLMFTSFSMTTPMLQNMNRHSLQKRPDSFIDLDNNKPNRRQTKAEKAERKNYLRNFNKREDTNNNKNSDYKKKPFIIQKNGYKRSEEKLDEKNEVNENKENFPNLEPDHKRTIHREQKQREDSCENQSFDSTLNDLLDIDIKQEMEEEIDALENASPSISAKNFGSKMSYMPSQSDDAAMSEESESLGRKKTKNKKSKPSDESYHGSDDEEGDNFIESLPNSVQTEIQLYLKENYNFVEVNLPSFLHSKKPLKEYALQCKTEQMIQILEFVTHRQTAFIRIWILISKTEGDAAFLIKQTHSVRREFYQRHFGKSPVKFWALKDERYTPSNLKEFVEPFNDVIIHNFFQHGKSKHNFLKDLEPLEKISKKVIYCFN